MHKVFISYSSKLSDDAWKVCNYLENRGISCWIAPRNIDPGSSYATQIVNAIRQSVALVLVGGDAVMARLGDICNKITDGSHNPPKGIAQSDCLMLSSKNVYDDEITYEDPRYISAEDFDIENKRTQVSAGDILLTIVGTVGRAAVVPSTNDKLCLQRSVAVIKPNKENFAVRQHLKYVELYANPENYAALSYEDTLIIKEELAPLITPDEDEPTAMRFDALMYGIELAYLVGKKYTKARSDLFKKVSDIAGVANIPEIMAQAELIRKILHTDYLDNAGINEFEIIRENLRNLIKYIPITKIRYDTNFDDEILSMDWHESELENDDLKNYKAKAEFYVRQHQDEVVIAKLKSNVPLTSDDVAALEKILWSEVGTKEDYEAEIGSKPLGEFVREIVGLDMKAAKEAFSVYLNDASLDSRQIYFVNQIVEYIVHNGLMKDLSVLQESPFTDKGSVVDIFTDLTVWMGIRKIIEQVNANAVA